MRGMSQLVPSGWCLVIDRGYEFDYDLNVHTDTDLQTTAVVGVADMRLKSSVKELKKDNNKVYTHANTIISITHTQIR